MGTCGETVLRLTDERVTGRVRSGPPRAAVGWCGGYTPNRPRPETIPSIPAVRYDGSIGLPADWASRWTSLHRPRGGVVVSMTVRHSLKAHDRLDPTNEQQEQGCELAIRCGVRARPCVPMNSGHGRPEDMSFAREPAFMRLSSGGPKVQHRDERTEQLTATGRQGDTLTLAVSL